MPLGTYIKGCQRISLEVPDSSLRSLRQSGVQNDSVLQFLPRDMRRDVGPDASLRTDPSIYALYGIICAQRRKSGNASAHGLHVIG